MALFIGGRSLALGFTLVVIGLILVAQIPMVQEVFIWERAALEKGQWWRLITGHFTHTNITHMVMNISGLVALFLLHKKYYQEKTLLVLVWFMMPVIGVLMYFTPYSSYAGLSGILHGLFAWGIIKDIQNKIPFSYALFLGFIVKLVWEYLSLGGRFTFDLIEAHVAYQAHWAGALIGILAALLLRKPVSHF